MSPPRAFRKSETRHSVKNESLPDLPRSGDHALQGYDELDRVGGLRFPVLHQLHPEVWQEYPQLGIPLDVLRVPGKKATRPLGPAVLRASASSSSRANPQLRTARATARRPFHDPNPQGACTGRSRPQISANKPVNAVSRNFSQMCI